MLYFVMLEKTPAYRRLNKAAVLRHVENIRMLDDSGKLAFCGAFQGYPGKAGMYILQADSREEAEALCKAEPLVLEGYATYTLGGLHAATKENNYLL